MTFLDFWQIVANIITVFGLPLAIYTFVLEQHKERDNEDEEVYQLLSDAYIDFLKLVLEHSDLKLAIASGRRRRLCSVHRSNTRRRKSVGRLVTCKALPHI